MSVGADNWADAPTIGLNGISDPTPNAGYTTESGEGEWGFRTAWWKFTASADGWIRFDVRGSSVVDPTSGVNDALVGVYSGASLATLTNVRQDYGLARVQVIAGTTYSIKVGGYSPDTEGTYVLAVSGYAVVGDWVSDDPRADREFQTFSQNTFAGTDLFDYGVQALVPELTGGNYPDLWAAVWSGDTVEGPVGGFVSSNGSTESWDTTASDIGGQDSVNWKQRWHTIRRTSTPTVTAGSTPYDWIDDPDVATLEWEPTDTPISQRLSGNVEYRLGAGNPSPVYVKESGSEAGVVTDAVDPGFKTAAEIAALPTVAQATGFPDFGGNPGTIRSFSGPLDGPLVGPATFVVGVASHFTIDRTPPPFAGVSGQAEYNIKLLRIFSKYRPRYRELRWDVVAPAPAPASARVTPSLRMLQRGGAGGMSGIPRMVGNPTRRGSVRQGPGSVY